MLVFQLSGSIFASVPYNSHATPIQEVRFKGYHPIKPHASVLVSRPANCIPFQPCGCTLEVTTLLLYILYPFLQLLRVQTTRVSNTFFSLHSSTSVSGYLFIERCPRLCFSLRYFRISSHVSSVDSSALLNSSSYYYPFLFGQF